MINHEDRINIMTNKLEKACENIIEKDRVAAQAVLVSMLVKNLIFMSHKNNNELDYTFFLKNKDRTIEAIQGIYELLVLEYSEIEKRGGNNVY